MEGLGQEGKRRGGYGEGMRDTPPFSNPRCVTATTILCFMLN
jgi:hypothetical protein